MSMNEVVKKLSQAIDKQADKAKTTAYDTPATVRRIEGDTAWVHIPGGVDETPVKLTISAKEGDQVQVRVSGGSAFMVGNGTNPPTDDARANEAYTVATVAEGAAENALGNAARAKEAADSAQASASAAESAAGDAVIAAGNAQTAAGNAQQSADSALVNLSTVQDVVGVLNWITAHGTMTLTSDVTVNPAHVYFVVDAGGDYVVGGTHYSIVSEPKDAELSTYYELSVDESVQNYVATHIVVDSEGLWIVPDSGGNKVLIATGAGSTYTTAGTYIVGKVNNVDTVLAKFTASGATIGQTGQTHTEIDYHSLQLIDKEGDAYFYISDLRDKNDRNLATITEVFTGNGTNSTFIVGLPIYGEEFTATDSSDSSNTATKTGATQCTFTTAPQIGATITITYKTSDSRAKAYSLGIRASGNIGAMSFAEGSNNLASGSSSHAEGYGTTASGTCSHAEGQVTEASAMCAHAEGYTTVANNLYSHAEGRYAVASGRCAHAEGDTTVASGELSHAEGGNTTASGHSSHAEGWYTVASGNSSRAQNTATIAQRKSQTVIGELNIADTGGTDETTRGDYAFIIGNGTADNARSNALTVDWSGNVEAAGGATLGDDLSVTGDVTATGDVTDGSGNVLAKLAEVQNTYGMLKNMSANQNLTASAAKINLKDFSGSNCSASSNGIKVSKAGVYEVSANVYLAQNFTANDFVHVMIYVNSTEVAHFQTRVYIAAMWTTYSTDRVILNLSANDTVYLYAYNQNGARGQLATSNTSTTSLTLNRIA